MAFLHHSANTISRCYGMLQSQDKIRFPMHKPPHISHISSSPRGCGCRCQHAISSHCLTKHFSHELLRTSTAKGTSGMPISILADQSSVKQPQMEPVTSFNVVSHRHACVIVLSVSDPCPAWELAVSGDVAGYLSWHTSRV